MLRPAMSDILNKSQDSYKFVVAVAKRAREIADEAEANNEIVVEKPVRLAVDEFAEGKVRMQFNNSFDI